MLITAGQVAARVIGKPWDDIVREKIFEPLGMSRTCTSINDFDQYTNVSTPHIPKDGKLVPIPWLNVDNIGPAGNVNSCALDLAKWIQLHLNKGEFAGKEIWNSSIQREMHSPQTIMPDQWMDAKISKHTHFVLYGLGWIMTDYRGKKFIYHGGDTDGMASYIGLVPEEKLGVAIIQNTSSNALQSSLAYRIIDAYLGVPEAEWVDLKAIKRPIQRESQKEKVTKLPVDTSPSLPLQSYTGVYTHPILENVKVELEDGKLVLDFDLYPNAVLEHKYLDTFQTKFEKILSTMWDRSIGHELDVTFHIDADTKVTELDIFEFGNFTRIKN